MHEPLAGALRTQRPKVRKHWEELLRLEPFGSPLANPDSLAHLIDWTLDEIYAAISNPLAHHRVSHHRSPDDGPWECACGRNPLFYYFSAGQQAMREALILAQAASPNLTPLERDASFQELDLVFEEISRRAIEAFCSVCGGREPGGSRAGELTRHTH